MSEKQGYFEVEQIVGKRRNPQTSLTEYHVRWKGYSSKYDTWEPLSNLTTCKDVIQNYNDKLKVRKLTHKSAKLSNKKVKLNNKFNNDLNPVVRISTSSNLSKTRSRFNKPTLSRSSRGNYMSVTRQVGSRRNSPNSRISNSNKISNKPTATLRRKPGMFVDSATENNVLNKSRTSTIKQQHISRSRPSSRSSSPVLSLKDITVKDITPIPMIDHDYILSSTKEIMYAPTKNYLNVKYPLNSFGEHDPNDDVIIQTESKKILDDVILRIVNSEELGNGRIKIYEDELEDVAEFISIRTLKIDPLNLNVQTNGRYDRKTSLRRNKQQEKFVHVLQRGKCSEIVLANEYHSNSLTGDILDELSESFAAVAVDDTCSVVLFGSVGDIFCSGINLQYLYKKLKSTSNSVSTAKNIAKSLRNFVNTIIDFPKPIVAVVQGQAIGLGCAILPLFDCVYASDRASFMLPYSAFGQSPEGCSSFLLPKIIGLTFANEMLLNGHVITAMEAKTVGLVVEVFCHDTLRRNLIPYLRKLAIKSPKVLAATKALIRNPEKAMLKHTNQYEYQVLKLQWADQETTENINKYLLTTNEIPYMQLQNGRR